MSLPKFHSRWIYRSFRPPKGVRNSADPLEIARPPEANFLSERLESPPTMRHALNAMSANPRPRNLARSAIAGATILLSLWIEVAAQAGPVEATRHLNVGLATRPTGGSDSYSVSGATHDLRDYVFQPELPELSYEVETNMHIRAFLFSALTGHIKNQNLGIHLQLNNSLAQPARPITTVDIAIWND